MTTVNIPVDRGGDGETYSDDANPTTGMIGADGYGYVTRFMKLISAMMGVANWIKDQADAIALQVSAAASSAASALNAPGTNATSTTSLTVGTGTKNLTLAQTGKAYSAGQTVVIASTASPNNQMTGVITSFTSGTGAMVVDAQQVLGSGTFAAWTISLGALVSSTLPSQTSQGGKFLTTNGTSASWAAAVIPSNNGSDFTNTATVRQNLGLIIGTNVQAQNANLNAFGGLTLIADRLPYANGSGTLALTTFTAFARTILDDVDGPAVRTTIGAQASHANLTAFAGLTGAADRLPYFTGSAALGLATLSAFARTILDDVDGDAVRNTINAAKKGENNDITKILGLTDPLSIAQGGTGAVDAAGARTALGIGFTASGMALCTVSGSTLTVAWISGNIAGITRSTTGVFVVQRSVAAGAAADWGVIAIPFGSTNQWAIQENYASRDGTYAFLYERNNASNAEDGAGFFLLMFDRPA
ncbi:MAG TPA: hypothetical protein VEA44_10615 [Caulobacter sp.]|nr:hypothetical protein [Caulobacter sp.]